MTYVANIERESMTVEPFGACWICRHSFKSSTGHVAQWFPTVRQCKEYGAAEYKWLCRWPKGRQVPKRITWTETP